MTELIKGKWYECIKQFDSGFTPGRRYLCIMSEGYLMMVGNEGYSFWVSPAKANEVFVMVDGEPEWKQSDDGQKSVSKNARNVVRLNSSRSKRTISDMDCIKSKFGTVIIPIRKICAVFTTGTIRVMLENGECYEIDSETLQKLSIMLNII